MTGEETYLTFVDAARRSQGDALDIHLFASVLAMAAADAAQSGSPLGETCGLTVRERAGLAAHLFPDLRAGDALAGVDYLAGPDPAPDTEEQYVRDILLIYASGTSALERPMAALIARRARAPHHLWQDLGLRNRDELSVLMQRYYGPLKRRNVQDMKWKKFLYRMVCGAEGFSLCTTPVCSECDDFAVCFGEETGEARLAVARLQSEARAT